jgi:hypothetical protein
VTTTSSHLLAGAAAALVLTALTVPAHADRPRHPTKSTTIGFHSHFDDPGFLTGFEGVDPAPPGVPQDAVFHGTSTVTGRVLSGTVVYTIWGHPQPDGSFAFHTYETLTGSLRGCGRGTIGYTVDGQTGGAPPAMTLTGAVRFVPGSGTDGLRRVQSGSGRLTGTTGLTTANSGDFDGQVVCRA